MSDEQNLAEAVRQLYSFIRFELDSDPGPVEHYLTGVEVQEIARVVVGDQNLSPAGDVDA